jgi:hypothetical protein
MINRSIAGSTPARRSDGALGVRVSFSCLSSAIDFALNARLPVQTS